MSDESFFREVDEDYRRAQAVSAVRKYGAYFAGGVFAIVALTGGYAVGKRRTAEQAASGGDSLTLALNALEDGKADDARKSLTDIAGKGTPIYRVLAQLYLAAEALGRKDRDTAAAAYGSVASDGTAPSTLRDFARLQLAALSADTGSYDKLAADLDAYRSGTSQWRFSAKEILGLAALREGKKSEAERLFSEIMSDGSAPQSMRQRAQVMLTLLVETPKAGAAVPPASGDSRNDAQTQ